LLLRIVPLGSDSDANVGKLLREFVQTMHQSQPEHFWNVWGTMKAGDRKVLNGLFGKDIEQDRSVLEVKVVVIYAWFVHDVYGLNVFVGCCFSKAFSIGHIFWITTSYPSCQW
jgi:hypothetical protein